MPRRWTIVWTFLLVLGAVSALGARATTLLDDVETALEEQVVALEGDTSKDGKKRFKAANGGLKKLAKETTSEAADLKLLKKVSGKLLKRFGDTAAVTQPIDAAADAFDASIDADLAEARSVLPVGKKVTAAKVSKAIAKAQKLLDKSRTKTTKGRIALLVKARGAANKAQATAAKFQPPTPDIPIPTAAYVVLPDQGNTPRVTRIDTATGARTVVDTGPGAVELEDPTPVESPDGTTIALQQGTNLVLFNPNATPAVVNASLTADWELSQWSPDSTMVAASGISPNTLAIFDRNGATVRSLSERVIENRAPDGEFLLWSPDGIYLAFRTDRDTNAVREVQVLNVGTGDLNEVSSNNLIADTIRFIAWSQVTDTIAYVADEDRNSAGVELVSVKPDGTGRTLLSLPGEDVRDSGAETSILANPVNDTILYEYRTNSMSYLATVGMDGSNPQTITAGFSNPFTQYAWSPDGSRVAYIGASALHSANPDGTDDMEITTTCPDFAWSESGTALIYRDGTGGSFGNELFVCDPDGSDSVRVSDDMIAGSNVEPAYGGLEIDDRVLVLFIADTTVNNRPDLHAVLLGQSGPGKLEELFKKEVASGAKFVTSSGEVKSFEFPKFVPPPSSVLVVDAYVAVTFCNPSGDPETTTEYFAVEARTVPVLDIEVLKVTTLETDEFGFRRLLYNPTLLPDVLPK